MGTTYKLTDHRSLTRMALTLLATLSLLATQMVGFTWVDPAGAEGSEPEFEEVIPEPVDCEAEPEHADCLEQAPPTVDCEAEPEHADCVEEEPAAVDCDVEPDDPSCEVEEIDCDTDPDHESCSDGSGAEETTALNVEAAEEPLAPLAVAGSGTDRLGFEIDGNFDPVDPDG